jgi:hypothetical protein
VVIIVFVVIIFSIIAATVSLSSIISITNYNNSNQGATSSLIQKQTRTISYNELIQYALRNINEDGDLLKTEGVYTIVVFLRHNHDIFPVMSYFIFFFH